MSTHNSQNYADDYFDDLALLVSLGFYMYLHIYYEVANKNMNKEIFCSL